MSASTLDFVAVGQDDPLAQPLLAELATEYASRYGGTEHGVMRWLRSHPAEAFCAPHGALLAELEAEIAARGYTRIYLTTGDRQPEAEALYLSTGYTRLAEPLPAEGEAYPVAFAKVLR